MRMKIMKLKTWNRINQYLILVMIKMKIINYKKKKSLKNNLRIFMKIQINTRNNNNQKNNNQENQTKNIIKKKENLKIMIFLKK